MGPRPPRRGAAAVAGALRPARAIVAAPRPVAPVGAPSPRRAPAVGTVPLPADTRRALSAIVKTMRDVPRALIGDPAEVVHFLGRTARALERLRDQPVPIAPLSAPSTARPSGPASALPSPPRALSTLERAEAVFRPSGAAPPPTAAPTAPQAAAEAVFRPSASAPPRPRIVMDRKGRGVRVEVRRARALGDLFEGPYG